MQITLTAKEFDDAVSLWLANQGFTPSSYTIDIHVIAGRTSSGAGTRVEVTLEPLTKPIVTEGYVSRSEDTPRSPFHIEA